MTQSTSRARVKRSGNRTYDGATGRLLGDASTDYVDFGIDPTAAQSSSWGDTGVTGTTDAAGSPAVLPQVTVTATPLGNATGPLGLPWWAWGLIGILGGYFIARNYGKHISRGLESASRIAHPV